MDPMTLLLLGTAAKGGMDYLTAQDQNALTEEQLAAQADQNKFSRLLQLTGLAQGLPSGMAAADRLHAIRNSGY